MSCLPDWLVWPALLCCTVPTSRAQEAQRQWSESDVVEQFLAQSPQSRELRATVAVAAAEARARTVYPNPSLAYSREGAGYNAFIEASQTLPLSGRIRLMREAGRFATSAAEANREALLWSLRSDLRLAFYRMVASQERLRILSSGAAEVGQLIGVLRKREDEGEGSRYDRLRTERESAELRTDMTAAQALIAAAAAHLEAFLPEGTSIHEVRGDLAVSIDISDFEALTRRAMNARADMQAERRNIDRYRSEEQAARRLRIPEPQISAGLKRADVISILAPNQFSDVTKNGLAISLMVPLPVFNNGRYEVARYQAEQEHANARLAVLARRIRADVEGARNVLAIRKEALTAYQSELESAAGELTRITRIAYQEGEIGILELLDSLRVNRAANLRLLDLQAAVKEAAIELERVVGEEVRP